MVFDFKFGAFLVLSLLAAPRVWGQPSSSERETARSLMIEGDRLRDAGDRSSALERYRAAHAIMHVPTTGLALAEAHAELGQLVEARGAAMDVMNLSVGEDEPAAFVAARKKAAALARSLEPRVATLTTSVAPAMAEYTLQIDEIVLPRAARAAPFKTNPGAHRVRVEAPGYEPAVRRVEVGEGETTAVSVALTPVAAPALAIAPLTAAPEPVDDPASAGRVRGIIGLSLGGVALAVGITTGAISWGAAHDEKSRCAGDGLCDASRASALSRANTLANVANVTIPVGVLGIAYGLFELLTLPDSPPAAAQARVQFLLSPQGVGMRGSL